MKSEDHKNNNKIYFNILKILILKKNIVKL